MSRLDVSGETAISMPMKNILAIIGAVAVGVEPLLWCIRCRITMLETKAHCMQKRT